MATMSDARGKRILIAEDNPSLQLVTKAILLAQGYSVSIADDGHEALTKFDTEKFDLILMDIQMPFKNGFEVTNHIRAYELNTGIKSTIIIGYSANSTDFNLSTCLKAGMNDYIEKPAPPALLIEIVKKWIS